MKNHQVVHDLYFKTVNTFANIDVELANMFFAQSGSFCAIWMPRLGPICYLHFVDVGSDQP